MEEFTGLLSQVKEPSDFSTVWKLNNFSYKIGPLIWFNLLKC